MTNQGLIVCLAAAGLALGGCAEPTATSPSAPPTTAAPVPADQGLAGFVGARAGQAENGLRARGYELARTEGLTAYWSNPASGECAEIVTADGRYQSVTPVSPAECGGAATAAVAPSAAEEACLAAITGETNNPDVRLIDSAFSEAGTLVRAAVGPEDAVWQCIAYGDGTTAGVQFTGSEGTL